MEKKELQSTQDGFKEFRHAFFDSFTEKDIEVCYRFKRPTPQDAERAQKRMFKSPGQALRDMCTSVVHPDDKEKMMNDFKDYPGLPSTLGTALLKSIGFADLGND